MSLQHGDSRSTSEITEASLTESAERIESIRKQIAAVVINKQGMIKRMIIVIIMVIVIANDVGCGVDDVNLNIVNVYDGRS